MHMWQLQVEAEHYSVNNWVNSITSSTGIFSPKVGTVTVDRWKLVCLIF